MSIRARSMSWRFCRIGLRKGSQRLPHGYRRLACDWSGGPGEGDGLEDLATPIKPRVFVRGNPNQLGDDVPRRFLRVLSHGEPAVFKNGSGRLDVARAIADRENPLTARVLVNRVWQYHFGSALVHTSQRLRST